MGHEKTPSWLTDRTRVCLRACLAILGVAFSGLAAVAQPPAGPPGPSAEFSREPLNVILINVDDMVRSQMSFLPGIQSFFSSRGVTFENCYVTTPICGPSRACLLTGRYAHNTRVRFNRVRPGEELRMNGFAGATAFHDRGLHEETVATAMSDLGYRTALIGKYMNDYGALAPSVPPGWHEWFAFRDDLNLFFDYTLVDNGVNVFFGREAEDYSTDVLRDRALRFIRRSRQPFFLYFAPYAPHEPATPAPRHVGLYPGLKAPRAPNYAEEEVEDKPVWIRDAVWDSQAERESDALYAKGARSLAAVDEAFEAFVSLLEELQILEQTAILFTSDNGFSFGAHRWLRKRCVYEESAHVDLLVHVPGLTDVPRSDATIVSNIDLMPTIIDLGRSDRRKAVPFHVDGKSLLPILEGRVVGQAFRESLLLEQWAKFSRFNDCEVSDVPPGVPPGPCGVPNYAGLILFNGWKYVVLRNRDEREFYDLELDPFELENSIDSVPRSLTRRFEEELRRLRGGTGR